MVVTSHFKRQILTAYPNPTLVRSLQGVTSFNSCINHQKNIQKLGNEVATRLDPSQIAGLHTLQMNGEKGELSLTDWNLFYGVLPGFVTTMRWNSDLPGWFFIAFPMDDYNLFDFKSRVFSNTLEI